MAGRFGRRGAATRGSALRRRGGRVGTRSPRARARAAQRGRQVGRRLRSAAGGH
jgi:hypothetical protein